MKRYAFDKLIAKIIDERKQARETQKDVASMLGVSLRTYANYERQAVKIPAQPVFQLCHYYGINMNAFIDHGESGEKQYSASDLKKVNARLDELIEMFKEGFEQGQNRLDSNENIDNSMV